MKLSEHKDLKQAIATLPEKEKDKLLLRLVAKDKILTEHLHFKLLESEIDLDLRKESIEKYIEDTINSLKKTSYKDALSHLRQLNSKINHFFKITKDNLGEAELRLYLLNAFKISYHSPYYRGKDVEYQFSIYFLKTVDALLKKVKKLHEDFQFDLTENLEKLREKTTNPNFERARRVVELIDF